MIWYAADAAATGIIYLSFEAGLPIRTTGGDPETDPADVWMHIQVRFSDEVSADPADDQVFTLDVLKTDGAFAPGDWGTSDFDLVTASISTFLGSIVNFHPNRYRASEIRFYRRAFNPIGDDKPYADAGGPSAIRTISIPMTGTIGSAPQITSTITEVTPSRKHWGRLYLPAIDAGQIQQNGRLLTTTVFTLAGNFQSMVIEDLSQAGYALVVPTTSSGGVFDPSVKGDWTKVKARTLQNVNGCRCDDVVDVIRRRRHKKPLQRAIQPPPA